MKRHGVAEIEGALGAIDRALEQPLRLIVIGGAAVAALPAMDPKMAGRVIGTIKKQFGDRADAQLTKKLAEELLGS